MYSKKLSSVLLILAIVTLMFSSCKAEVTKPEVNAKELTASFNKTTETLPLPDDNFKLAMANFSLKAFLSQAEVDCDKKNNTMLPTAEIYNSLMFLSNSAGGDMKKDFETALYFGKTASDYNSSAKAFTYLLTNNNSQLNMRCSLWINNNVKASVKESFLQTTVDYYDADVYKLNFAAKNSADEMKKWFEFYQKSSGSTVGEVSESNVMYLLAVSEFSDSWKTPVNPNESYDGAFLGIDGKRITVPFMISEEEYYIGDSSADGFVKDYKGGRFKFIALLPKDDMSVTDYIKTLDGEKYLNLISGIKGTPVLVRMPKFEAKAAVSQNGLVSRLGLSKSFDKKQSDFTSLMRKEELTYLSDFRIYSTFSINELGSNVDGKVSKNADSTSDGFKDIVEREKVTFDRSFIYMVIDNTTLLPVIMGTVVAL